MHSVLFNSIPLATLLAHVFLVGACCARAAEPLAYVANQGSDSVSVIDTATNSVTATVPVGTYPLDVAVSPSRATVYVVNMGPFAEQGTVSVIDAATNVVIATVPVGNNPARIAITPDGSTAYVTNPNSGNVSVIDTTTNSVSLTVPVGRAPVGIAIAASGAAAYVADGDSTFVYVVSTAANAVVATILTGAGPHSIAITPDGTRAYVALGAVLEHSVLGSVRVIDTNTYEVVARVVLPAYSLPGGPVITPDGAFVYLANFFLQEIPTRQEPPTVVVIDTATNTIGTTIAVGDAGRLAITPDGRFAYLTQSSSARVAVIDTSTNTITATIPVGLTPTGIAIAPAASSPTTPSPSFREGGGCAVAPLQRDESSATLLALFWAVASWCRRHRAAYRQC